MRQHPQLRVHRLLREVRVCPHQPGITGWMAFGRIRRDRLDFRHRTDGRNYSSRSTYPCYYNPDNPNFVTVRFDLGLTKKWFLIFFSVPAALWIISCSCLVTSNKVDTGPCLNTPRMRACRCCGSVSPAGRCGCGAGGPAWAPPSPTAGRRPGRAPPPRPPPRPAPPPANAGWPSSWSSALTLTSSGGIS